MSASSPENDQCISYKEYKDHKITSLLLLTKNDPSAGVNILKIFTFYPYLIKKKGTIWVHQQWSLPFILGIVQVEKE